MRIKILYLLTLICGFITHAQVGTGVELEVIEEFSFSPTTKDSTTSVIVTVKNTVASEQQITFTGLDHPFYISEESITIGANDSSTITLNFTPDSIGEFNDVLEFSGNIFGYGSFLVGGESVQASISSNIDSLSLGSIAVNNPISSTITLYNTGTGTLEISDISTSNSDFTVYPVSAIIPEDSSIDLNVSFSSSLAGYSSATISITNNDIDNIVYDVFVDASAVSEISGTICGTLERKNSPFTVLADLVVPSNCSLYLEPGVVINGNGFDLLVDGILEANGTSSDSIFLREFQDISIKSENPSFNYVNILQSSDFLFFDNFEENNFADYFNAEPEYIVWNSTYGNNGSGIKITSDGDYDIEVYTDSFIVNSDKFVFNFDYKNNNISRGCYPDVNFFYRINTGEWIFLESIPHKTNWTNKNYDISHHVNLGDNIHVKFENQYCSYRYSNSTYYNRAELYLDNFGINYIPNTKLSASGISISNSKIESNKTEFINRHLEIDFEDEYQSYFTNSLNDTEITNSGGFQSLSSMYFKNTTDLEVIPIVHTGDLNLSFNYKILTENSNWRPNLYVYYKLNNDDWIRVSDDLMDNYISSNNWQYFNKSIPGNSGDELRIKISYYKYNNTSPYIDRIFISGPDKDVNILNSEIHTDLILSGNAIFNSVDYNAHKYGIFSEGGSLLIDSSSLTGGSDYVCHFNDTLLTINNSVIKNGENNGLNVSSNNAIVSIYNSTISRCGGHGLYLEGDYSEVVLKYSFIENNNGIGISTTGLKSHVNLSSSMVTGNSSYGIQSSGQVNLNYSNITFNEDDGIYLTGNNFSNIKNSIIWGNDIVNYTQIHTTSGVTSISYSTVQGSGAYGTSGSQYYFGDGSIDDDPVFENADQHMSSFSNCVDAGTPWESDANMPFGLGGVRADIGIYGGPDNGFWGGTNVPDGATFITQVEDKPQDQGGHVAVVFDASVWDKASLVNNVTSYAVWRHFDPEGDVIDSVSSGNWELIAEMPAQSFESYAITAESLGDSTITEGDFNTCFVVVALTDDDDVFWYSNVLCGYSTDDIGPEIPEGFTGDYNYFDGLRLNWETPADDDYLESNIYQNGVWLGKTNRNNFVDTSAIPGKLYDYKIEHIDAAGNPSDQAFIDVSTLLPKWEPKMTPRTHHIAIPKNINISTTNDPIDRGDFLGVFYNNDGNLECGGIVQWSDNEIVMTAFGDSEELEGFEHNEAFVWKFWDASKNEYYHADVTYDHLLPNSARFLEDGLSALKSIEIYSEQDIDLIQGWSMISSYVMEDDPLMSTIMAPVKEDVFLMKDEHGHAYWPSYNFNEIGNLSEDKGYKLLMKHNHLLSFRGRKIIPNEKILKLEKGWQIIPYLRENSASVDQVFEDIKESIIIVKDDLGRVYWPDWDINSIGELKPGKGYQVKMYEDKNFNYPANSKDLSIQKRTNILTPTYFEVPELTETNMTLGIPIQAWGVTPKINDEIAVFDAQDRVRGVGVFNGDNMVISIWGDDEHNNLKTGFYEGEQMTIKLRDMESKSNFNLNITDWQDGSNEFKKDEIAIVSSIHQGERVDDEFKVYPVMPNPSSSDAHIQIFSPSQVFADISLYNILGELIFHQGVHLNEGMSIHNIPSSTFANGAYELKVQLADKVDVQSIHILK